MLPSLIYLAVLASAAAAQNVVAHRLQWNPDPSQPADPLSHYVTYAVGRGFPFSPINNGDLVECEYTMAAHLTTGAGPRACCTSTRTSFSPPGRAATLPAKPSAASALTLGLVRYSAERADARPPQRWSSQVLAMLRQPPAPGVDRGQRPGQARRHQLLP